MTVRVGTSGWVYDHWRGIFYPEDLRQADWLGYYAREFDAVEINSTFYRLPSEAAFDRWREQAAPAFAYAVKASRFLTHVKKLKDQRNRSRGSSSAPAVWAKPSAPCFISFHLVAGPTCRRGARRVPPSRTSSSFAIQAGSSRTSSG